ncbi:MAG: integration host factor subunit beta [Deferrisomatales bacterium]|nr:integration host factor subunit beta [Deferrisomatales bacterium]HSH69534.1 HU family DNA-binding protein [Deferrisomatales bacterium]
MNKSDLVKLVAERGGLSMKAAKEAVNVFFDAFVDAILQDERIEIRGFGSFANKKYDGYMGRNPKTGEPIRVPDKKLPFFKVGKELKVRVDTDS